jgi:hypothetical protein
VSHSQHIKPVITWQAKPIIGGEHWQILTAKGEMQAAIFQTVCKTDLTAQQAAELMADAPLLLNELKLTHDALLALSQQEQCSFKQLIPLAARASERLTLLMKYRHLLGGVQ